MHGAIVKEHPEAYPASADFRIDAVGLRDQIVSPARTVLLVLLAASALVFVIACSNVANLILARSVRREGELAIRAALGASAGALRRTLLAESLLLCGAGAILGVAIARPMVAILARYAARFSVRALDLTVDASLLWVGVEPGAGRGRRAGVRSAAAVGGRARAASASRPAACASRRARTVGCALFAVTQIAASFVLLAGAGMLLTALVALQAAPTGFKTRNVLALNVPVDLVRAAAGTGRRLLQGSAAAHLGAAGRRARRRRHDRAVARRRGLRSGIPVFGRGIREGQRRGGSARAVPHGIAGILRRARRADHRRP